MKILNKTVALEIISCLIVGCLGAVLAFVSIPFPISLPIPWLWGVVFTVPAMMSFQFICNLNNLTTDLRSDLNTTEINRYQDAIAPIKVMLYCYFGLFLISGIFVGWSCSTADKSYAKMTLPIAVGLTLVAVRFLIVLLKRNEQLAETKDKIKADAEHRKKLEIMESDMGLKKS